MRRWLLCLALLAPCVAGATDLHLQPVDTRVSREFRLGPSVFYLPEGNWVLAAKGAWGGTLAVVLEGPPFAGVFLFDVRDRGVARAIFASTNIEPVTGNQGWRHTEDPCKRRGDVFLHRELGENYHNQYCVQVNHRTGFLVDRKGWVEGAQGWLVDKKLTVPHTMVAVEFTRIDRAFQTRLHYYFNPDVDGVPPSVAKQWKASEWHRDRVAKDPARSAYIEMLAKWANDAAAPVYAGLTDAKLKPLFPQAPYPAGK